MQWTLYCRVVDNFGDIGVAWRLAVDLAERGERVRLACDDASALAWLAPDGADGVEVCTWGEAAAPAGDAIVELFGGGLPGGLLEGVAALDRPPVVVNVEHLSAEAYVERSHGLPSPRFTADGRTATTWFFYPGFVPATGGLLREPGLLERRRAFGRGDAWLRGRNIEVRPGERRVALFCYDDSAVPALIDALCAEPTLLLATAGPAAGQVCAALGPSLARGALRAVCLPALPQIEFDRLLWSCDLNFVRGEDSLVRAIWAGVPFVWQLYRQSDGVQAAKLAAFLDRMLAGASPVWAADVRRTFQLWNAGSAQEAGSDPLRLPRDAGWGRHCSAWRDALAGQADLATRLVDFARSKR